MFKRKLVMAVGGLLASASLVAFAHGGGGAGGAGVGAGFGGGFGNGNGGTVAAGHASSHGAVDSNGILAADRDKGLQRADDRMSQEGLINGKSGKGHTHGRHTHTHHHTGIRQ